MAICCSSGTVAMLGGRPGCCTRPDYVITGSVGFAALNYDELVQLSLAASLFLSCRGSGPDGGAAPGLLRKLLVSAVMSVPQMSVSVARAAL